MENTENAFTNGGAQKMRLLADIAPITKASQLCAILPLFRQDDGDLFITPFGRAYAYLLCLVILVSSALFGYDVVFHSRSYKIIQKAQGDTEDLNQTIETVFCLISYTVIVLSCISNGNKHCRALRDINKIDEYLEANGFCGVYKCPILSTVLGLLAVTVVVVAFFYVHIQSDMDVLRQCVLLIVYTLQMFISSIFAIYIRILLFNVTRRIEFVNSKLQEFTAQNYKENWNELANLIMIFCKFRFITETINAITGVSLFFYMGFAFYTVTNQSYLAFSTLTSRTMVRKSLDAMGLSAAWVLAEIITMIVICNACDAITSEANVTSQILARIYGKSKEYQNIIDKFLTKSIKQEVQFTAYGFFVIDNSTLFKIFSAVTTYLVILIQFKQLEDSKMEDQQTAATQN